MTMNYSDGTGVFPHYQFALVIYTVFKNYGRESYRKEGLRKGVISFKSSHLNWIER
jgi:hypothetical protein